MERTVNKAKKIIRGNEGYTLAEVLMAVLIMLLVSSIVAAGIPVARNAYERVVLASNGEVVLSTTITALRNELGTAQKIEVNTANDEIVYYNPARGTTARIYFGPYTTSKDITIQTIMIQHYYSKDSLSKGTGAVPLISEKSATADLYVACSKVTYKDGIVTFENLSVDRQSGDTGVASRESISIRVISYQKDAAA